MLEFWRVLEIATVNTDHLGPSRHGAEQGQLAIIQAERWTAVGPVVGAAPFPNTTNGQAGWCNATPEGWSQDNEVIDDVKLFLSRRPSGAVVESHSNQPESQQERPSRS